VTYAEKATTQQQNLIIRFVRRWKMTSASANNCYFTVWFSFITYLKFGNKKSIRKRKTTFIPKPQRCGLDGKF